MSLVDVVPLPRRLAARLAAAKPTPPQDRAERFELRAAVDGGDTTELLLYTEVGGWFGLYSDEFAELLNQVTTSDLTVRINSPGGSAWEGIAIANLLRAHPARVTCVVDGVAASIASIIALAGDELVMQPQSQLMVHDAWTCTVGDPAEHREAADWLDKQCVNLADAYAAKAGGTREEWRAKMVAETWYLADEAVEAGLADRVAEYPRAATVVESDEPVVEEYDLAASASKPSVKVWDLSIFRYAGRSEAPDPLAEAPVQPVAELVLEPDRAVALVDLAAVRAEVERAFGVVNTEAPAWFTTWVEANATPAPIVESDVTEPPADGLDPPTDEAVTDEPPAEPEPDPAPPDDDEKDDWSAAVASLTAPTDRWAAATAHLRGTAGDDRSATRPEVVR